MAEEGHLPTAKGALVGVQPEPSLPEARSVLAAPKTGRAISGVGQTVHQANSLILGLYTIFPLRCRFQYTRRKHTCMY